MTYPRAAPACSEEGDRGDDFSTVLIIAVRKQDLSMVRLLLEHGADANKAMPTFAGDHDRNQDGKPVELPLSVALETGNAPIIELLKSDEFRQVRKGPTSSDEFRGQVKSDEFGRVPRPPTPSRSRTCFGVSTAQT